MSIFYGTNNADIITPDTVSTGVLAVGLPKKPSAAVDYIYSGGGDDFVAAGGGNDFAILGTGNDTFVWNPGDGSDFVDGEADSDTLIFNGSAAAESMTLSADGTFAKLFRDVANITMTLTRLETIDIAALGGTDTITVNDLTGTGVTDVNLNLAGTIGGTTGDGAADTVFVNATEGDDIILLSLQGGALVVEGLAARIVVENFDAALDLIVIRGLGGDDTIDASAVGAGAPLLTLDGGTGSNTVIPPTGTTDPDFILTTVGSGGNDTLTISRNAAGQLFVNGVLQAGKTVANTTLIRAFGLNGNDTITLDETNGALPAAELYGGNGNDALTGGSASDTLFGGADNDVLLGRGGNDLLFGGDGNDVLTGGDADDQLFGEGGDDRMIWNPGDDTDLFEGGDGTDTAEVNGGGGSEIFTATANGTRVRFDRLDPAPFSLDIGTSERLVVNMNNGDDSFSATGNLAALIGITVDGGAGNDTILGSNGIDTLLGGDGDDFIDGQQGNDTAFLGAGTDVFRWDPGDGSDVVEGQAGIDTLLFNGSAGNEIMAVSANGGRALFTRNLGNIVMDLDDIEVITANALGGTDSVTVNDLTGTDVTQVNVNLAGTIGGTTGDGAADTVIVNATSGDDIILLSLQGGALIVEGLAARIVVENFDAASDRIVIQGLGGEDIVDATAVGAGALLLTLDGGSGNDILRGGVGNDTLLGGDGNDVLLGGGGANVLDGGAGSNILIQPTATTDHEFILTTFGSGGNDALTISRNAAGQLLVNGVVQAGKTVANTALIRTFGLNGNDTITLNEASGALPAAALYGGGGNDTVTGGSGGDTLFGQSGNDTLLGRGGFDMLFGGDGNDVLTGGDADDQLFGEGGDDRMIWNPGDDTDLFEGGDGTDTAEVNGGNGAEVFTVTANGTRVRFDRVTPAPFSIDIGTTERLVVEMNGGDDSFSTSGNLAALIGITVDGGTGNDTILGSNGADLLLGGDGNDFIDGQQGNDTALLGAGDDIFQWDPGDGSDVVEGQDGIDTMLFNGSAANEIMAVSANGGRTLFTRNVGNIVMDLNDVELIDVNLLGGADTLTVNDLTGTDVTQVDVNLAGVIGGAAGDAIADVVTVNGRGGADTIDIFGAGTSVTILGASASVNIVNLDGGGIDRVVVNGNGGNDTISATTVPAGVTGLTIDGGTGDDSIFGSQGADTILGGDGNDFVFGDNGNDVALMGAGDDVFQWNPGDGNDVVEGQDGADELLFFGANIAENIDIAANGGRALFLRNVANITMDLNDVERIDFKALGGADNITLGDLSGTDVTEVNLDLAGPAGGGDGAVDTVTVNASNAANVFGASSSGGVITVFGLSTAVHLTNVEGANDRLTLNGQGGDDVINGSGLAAGSVQQLIMNGGLGADLFVGSAGSDLVTGGDGNDTALLGLGDDVFVWNPGDDNDIVEGQGGSDLLRFNGANIAERITLSANGGRALFTRDVASVLMDLNDVETIEFNALGGADNIAVNDLTGTDVTTVNLNLSGTLGGTAGDGAADTITIFGTLGDDVVVVAGEGGILSVIGLAARINITGFESANDRLVIMALDGDDVIEASGLTGTNPSAIVGDGGNGDDILIGGDGNDVLSGGAGDDVLLGGPGLDVLDGGAGDNVLIQ